MAIKNFLRTVLPLANIGIYMVSAIIVGLLIGYFLDKWLKTQPVFFLIFLMLGIVEGFRNLIVSTQKYAGSDDDNKKNK